MCWSCNNGLKDDKKLNSIDQIIKQDNTQIKKLSNKFIKHLNNKKSKLYKKHIKKIYIQIDNSAVDFEGKSISIQKSGFWGM